MLRPVARGFTLLEIMVVIGLIAILASLLLPNLSRSRGRANLTACGQNTTAIGTAVMMYMTDNAGQFPRENIVGPGSQWNGSGQPYLVPKYLGAYPVCPSVKGSATIGMPYQLVVGKYVDGTPYAYIGCFSSGHTSMGSPQGYPKYSFNHRVNGLAETP